MDENSKKDNSCLCRVINCISDKSKCPTGPTGPTEPQGVTGPTGATARLVKSSNKNNCNFKLYSFINT